MYIRFIEVAIQAKLVIKAIKDKTIIISLI